MCSQVNKQMVVDVVNSNDTPIDTAKRDEVLSEGLNFRTVHIFVLNKRKDKLLLQQLGENRDRHPGYFGSSVAAYLFSGESYLGGATRRLEQELSVNPDHVDLNWHGKKVMEDNESTKFVGLYTTCYEGLVDPDLGHIKDIKWEELANIDNLIASDNVHFTPTFKHVWSIFVS